MFMSRRDSLVCTHEFALMSMCEMSVYIFLRKMPILIIFFDCAGGKG